MYSKYTATENFIVRDVTTDIAKTKQLQTVKEV